MATDKDNGMLTPTVPASLTPEGRLKLANRLYREFHVLCFWHCPPDLIITEDLMPLVVKGLRQHGGRRGFILSGKLRQRAPARKAARVSILPGASDRAAIVDSATLGGRAFSSG
jgi:hypothetical protein